MRCVPVVLSSAVFGVALAVGGCDAATSETPPPPAPQQPAPPVTKGFPNPWQLPAPPPPPVPPPAPAAPAADQEQEQEPSGQESGTETSSKSENSTPEEGSSSGEGVTCELGEEVEINANHEITNRACGYTEDDGTERSHNPWIDDQLKAARGEPLEYQPGAGSVPDAEEPEVTYPIPDANEHVDENGQITSGN